MAPALSLASDLMRPHKPNLVHDVRIFLLSMLAGAPAVLVAMIFVWRETSPKVEWTLTVVIVGFWLGFSFGLRERVASPLRTLANLLEAMREGDYSIRAKGTRADDPLGEVMQQINMMGSTLRSQRLGALEATTLLRKVMEEINVSVFAFDGDQKLRLVNRAGERLLGEPVERLLGKDAIALGLGDYLVGDPQQTVQRTFPASSGRWSISRTTFREGGLPHQLLVLTDLTRPLREEELKAWQRLVRVLGHELNNSLAPDQIDCRKPGKSAQPQSAAARLGRGYAARPDGDRFAQRRPQPLHRVICAVGPAASADAQSRARQRVDPPCRGPGNARSACVDAGSRDDHPGRWRPTRTTADQRDPQCRRRVARDRRARARRMGPPGFTPVGVGAR